MVALKLSIFAMIDSYCYELTGVVTLLRPQMCIFETVPTKQEFLVPQMEYPLGGSSKTGSHVHLLLIVAMVLLL